MSMTNHTQQGSRRRQKCRFCSQSYQKHEHLIRHERTHTGDRPFQCEVCNRSFARHDTLARHKRIHRNQSPDGADGFLPLPFVPQVLSDQRLPNQTAAIDWPPVQTFEQPNFQPLDVAQDNSLQPLDIEPPGFSPFGGTEDYLQYIFPSPQDGAMPFSPEEDLFATGVEASPAQADTHGRRGAGVPEDTSPPALLQLNAMIHDSSARYKQSIRRKGINSIFFDACLSLFFSQFNPTFPIVHEPTWKLKTTGPFLLLNMVAIGSLFIGNDDAISKGEFLWEIAQTAAATRWNYSYGLNLRHVSGDYPNTQIVTCAVLGQLYAMMSKSLKLRHMAQTLHGWAFSWARTLGMFDLPILGREAIPKQNETPQAKLASWKRWADIEMQRRTVLGLFIVDAQLARYSGGIPLGKHVLNSLQCASSDNAFGAQSPDDWLGTFERDPSAMPSFREVFLSALGAHSAPLSSPLSSYSVLVLFEGVQALISESGAAKGAAIGTQTQSDIVKGIFYLHNTALKELGDSIEAVELRIRWHTLCIDAVANSVQLFRSICRTEQQVFCVGQTWSSPDVDTSVWSRSVEARIALLHAMTIQDLAQRLHLGRAHAVGAPMAVFAAATIYCAFLSANIHEFRVPMHIDLKEAHEYALAKNGGLGTATGSGNHTLQLFLQDKPLQSTYKVLNLRQGLYKCQVVLRTVAGQWGIAKDMLELLAPWTSTT